MFQVVKIRKGAWSKSATHLLSWGDTIAMSLNRKGVIYIFDVLLIAGLACIVSGFFLLGIVQGVFALGVGLIIMAVLVADAHTVTYEIEVDDKEDEDS